MSPCFVGVLPSGSLFFYAVRFYVILHYSFLPLHKTDNFRLWDLDMIAILSRGSNEKVRASRGTARLV